MLRAESKSLKESFNISSAMEHADDLNLIWHQTIEDDVVTLSDTPETWCYVVSFAPDFGLEAQTLASLLKLIHDQYCSSRIIIGDIVVDID